MTTELPDRRTHLAMRRQRNKRREWHFSSLSLSIRMSVCVDWITRLEYVRRLRRGNSIEESVTGEPPTMIRRGQSLVRLFKVRENLQSSHLEALQTEASPIYHHYRNVTVTKPSNEISKLIMMLYLAGDLNCPTFMSLVPGGCVSLTWISPGVLERSNSGL